MFTPNSAATQDPAVVAEIMEINTKRRRLSNILRFVTFAFILGDFYGFSDVLGVSTFFIGIIMMFTRGFIVRKVYPAPASTLSMGSFNMNNPNMANSGINFGSTPNQNTYSDADQNSATDQFNTRGDNKQIYDVKMCSTCGKQTDLDAVFCENCGSKY